MSREVTQIKSGAMYKGTAVSLVIQTPEQDQVIMLCADESAAARVFDFIVKDSTDKRPCNPNLLSKCILISATALEP